MDALKREVSRPRVPGSPPARRQQQKTHWTAMLARGDAMAEAVEREHALRHLPYAQEDCATRVCLAARTWREARG